LEVWETSCNGLTKRRSRRLTVKNANHDFAWRGKRIWYYLLNIRNDSEKESGNLPMERQGALIENESF